MKNPLLLELPEKLHTANLVLKLPRVGTGPAMFDSIGASLPELERWQTWAQNLPSLEECELECRGEIARIAARTAVIYHLFARGDEGKRQQLEDAVFVGEIGFSVIDWNFRKFELRFWLDSRFTGRGLMTEAAQALTHFAFESLEARRVFMLCDSRNTAARKVAEKCGFAFEAVLKNNALDAQNSSVWVDEYVYARVE